MSLGDCKLRSFKGNRARDKVLWCGLYTDVGSTIVEDL